MFSAKLKVHWWANGFDILGITRFRANLIGHDIHLVLCSTNNSTQTLIFRKFYLELTIKLCIVTKNLRNM